MSAVLSEAERSAQELLPEQYLTLQRELSYAVCRVCPRWMSEDAEDLVQEALIRLIKRSSKGLSLLAVNKSYLRKVAYSAVIDEMRRRQRRVAIVTNPSEEGVEAFADSTAARDTDIGDAISDCLTRQNPSRRQALTLYLLGHSVPEAARIIQSPPKRVENLVYRGLAQLRKCLQAKGVRP